MILEFILLSLGLAILVKSSDYFVEYASALAEKLGVSKLVIGLTIVALGTSLPELVSSVIAAINGAEALAIGNIVGSNITNICLILGLSASLAVVKIEEKMLYRDGLIMMAVSLVFYIFMLDGGIEFSESVIMVILFFIYTFYVLEFRPRFYAESLLKIWRLFTFEKIKNIFFVIKQFTLRPKMDHNKENYNHNKENTKASHINFKESAWFDFLIISISGVFLWIGAELTVKASINIASSIGIGTNIIGLSVVALGTSLPELVVSITSVRKGHNDILVGNILGSNITNILLVGGVSGLFVRLIPAAMDLTYTMPYMVIITLILLLFMKSRMSLRKYEGGALLTLYMAFIIWLASWVL